MRANITMKKATLQGRNQTRMERSKQVFVDGSNKFGQRSKVIIKLFFVCKIMKLNTKKACPL